MERESENFYHLATHYYLDLCCCSTVGGAGDGGWGVRGGERPVLGNVVKAWFGLLLGLGEGVLHTPLPVLSSV